MGNLFRALNSTLNPKDCFGSKTAFKRGRVDVGLRRRCGNSAKVRFVPIPDVPILL
jgi:hypothetical protein